MKGVLVAFAVALALLGADLLLGQRTTVVRVSPPCGPRPLFPRGGVDGTTQRIVLDGLGRAACRLGVTREALVVSLAPQSGEHLHQPDPKVERALREGLAAAIDAAEHRGEIPGLLAFLARQAVEHAPLDRLVQGRLF